jgi:hypothetical protein
MGVLIEAISVVVPTAALAARYPGGPDGFERDAPNWTHCTDGYIACVRFMVPQDAREYIDHLYRHGLRCHERGVFVEVGVVDQVHGPTAPSDWLIAGRSPLGYSVAWLAGTQPFPMAHPAGWKIEHSSQLHFATAEEADERFISMGRRGSLDVLLDFSTGKEMYIGRTTDVPLNLD